MTAPWPNGLAFSTHSGIAHRTRMFLRAALIRLWIYMQDGWREGPRPAPGFGAEDYAQVEREFDTQVDNPITHLLQVGLGDPAVCR
jgi:hypothetical protein